jgi:hypothetical protein
MRACRSIDDGKHWKDLPASLFLSRSGVIDKDRKGVAFGVSTKGVDRLWLYDYFPKVSQIEADPKREDIFYVLAWNGLYKSQDAGSSFELLSLESDKYRQIDRIAVDPVNRERVYAAVGRSTIWASTDGGCRWHVLRILGQLDGN